MASINALEQISSAKRVVLKIGSALLVDVGTGQLRQKWLENLAVDVAMLRSQGKDVLIVSSGSIALGRSDLGLPKGALNLEQAQAAAAVGQIHLAQTYRDVLSKHDIQVAQILVTLEDSENRRRYLNSRATLGALLEMGVVPIVNENDTVATDEIRFGDNDRLASQVASLVEADILILLSDIDGLYTSDPRNDEAAHHLDTINEVTPEIMAMAGDAGSEVASGGMKTKIMAAKVSMHAGCKMAICMGDVDRPISALSEGANATWFCSDTKPGDARKRWIASMKPKGKIYVDEGAAAAIKFGKSLLPAGIVNVSGDFQRGEVVDICNLQDFSIGRAITRYSSKEAIQIMGCHSKDVFQKLGHIGPGVIAHRNDMALG